MCISSFLKTENKCAYLLSFLKTENKCAYLLSLLKTENKCAYLLSFFKTENKCAYLLSFLKTENKCILNIIQGQFLVTCNFCMNQIFWEWERARAGIEPTAAAPSQPDCPGVGRSDHSAGSKESASWPALGLRSDWHGRLGIGKREKEGKETSGRGSQDEPAQEKEENSILCPAPVRPGCLFRLFLSLLSASSQPPIDRVSPNVALKLVTKPIVLNRPSGLSD